MISVLTLSITLATTAILLAAALVTVRRAEAGRTLARHQHGVAIAELELRLCELQQRSVRDALTGLFNRRHADESIVRELRQTRHGTPMSVILIDIDSFKRINDGFGHAGGDAVLQQLARLLLAVCEADDVVCRYGGEEFLIVLPDATLEVARMRAKCVRELVLQCHPHLHGEPLGSVSISAGVASSPEHGRTVEALVAAADRALYAAKHTGRDRVVTASTLQVAERDAA